MRLVALVGRVPPPYGGVSVHLTRLLHRAKAANARVQFYDLEGRSFPDDNIRPAAPTMFWLLRFLLNCEEEVVHIHPHGAAMTMVAAVLLWIRGKQLVVTFHGESTRRW